MSNAASRSGGGVSGRSNTSVIQSLVAIKSSENARIRTEVEEFNRVLGGGIVPGSVVLLGGDPGIGKSTLLLQVSQLVAASGKTVLYVSGEESPEQIKLRADRLGNTSAGIGVLAESDVDAVVLAATADGPDILIVDSIQTMQTTDLESAPGSISQVKESAARLVQLAKATGIAVFVVGHVTKEGNLAGPKVLEHMVDVVLQLEGDQFQAYRLLRGVKNRYGATNEIGVFDMDDSGLKEVVNPSSLFISDGNGSESGCATTVAMEGSRPLLVEIQAISTRTAFGLPRRSTNGLDINRLHMLAAVLCKRAKIDVSTDDIYVNVVGGLRLTEPAVDLATVVAIYTSHRDVAIPRAAVIGEVGLRGELRPVQHSAGRLREASRLGIELAVVPERTSGLDGIEGIRVLRAASVTQALQSLSNG